MPERKRQTLDTVVRSCTPLGAVTGKAMFGGFGVFCDGLMFALVTRAGDLYFKADDANRPAFEAAGLERYGRMPYYRAPAEALTGWRALEPWARAALAAARRAPKSRRRR